MHELITVDLGPDFFMWCGQLDGRLVCAVTPRVQDDATVRRTVMELVKRQGVCDGCSACPLGLAS